MASEESPSASKADKISFVLLLLPDHIHLGFSGVFGREFAVKGPVLGVDDKGCRKWCISGVRALGYEKLTEQLWGPKLFCAMVLSVDAHGGGSFAVVYGPHLGIPKSVLTKSKAVEGI